MSHFLPTSVFAFFFFYKIATRVYLDKRRFRVVDFRVGVAFFHFLFSLLFPFLECAWEDILERVGGCGVRWCL